MRKRPSTASLRQAGLLTSMSLVGPLLSARFNLLSLSLGLPGHNCHSSLLQVLFILATLAADNRCFWPLILWVDRPPNCSL